jgi:rod shape-determining protein MreD
LRVSKVAMIGRKQWLNGGIVVGSALLCLGLSPTRLPGMTLLGLTPNWVLIWVVIWSLKRSQFQAVVAGIALGLIQDGMTGNYPSHAIGLAIVGYLTARLQKQRFLKEDFISVALIVFGMEILAETAIAIQLGLIGSRSLPELWQYYQPIVLTSAILSSLWAPILYFPLNAWWESLKT